MCFHQPLLPLFVCTIMLLGTNKSLTHFLTLFIISYTPIINRPNIIYKKGATHIMKMTPYRPRSIRFIEWWEIDGWTMKVYGISSQSEYPKQECIVLGKKIALEQLHTITVPTEIYHLGFIIVHETANGIFILIDYWTGENMLCSHAYFKENDSPTVSDLTPSGLTACIWELRVIHFERDAWVEHVLLNDQAPDKTTYVQTILNEDI